MQESLKHKTLKGTIWSTVERFSVQGVQFVVMILMARVLLPSDYGITGMITIFIAISQSLVNSGFSQALIRKQDRTQVDNSTVFYFNIVVGTIFYLILFFCAPLIARFYNEPLLTPVTRIVSLSIVINSFAVVQRAQYTLRIDFKTQAKATLSASIVSGAIGIIMAYLGYGVWALVWYQIINLVINVALLWVFSNWRPSWVYSWKSFKELFNFGFKLALSGLLDTVFSNIYLLIIGKVYKAADLGYYTRAQHFAQFPSSNLTAIIQRVTFPVLCTIQDDDNKLRSIYQRFLRLSAFIVFPMMIGLSVLAKPLILTLLNPEWEFSATLLSIMCFGLMWYPIHAINLNLLQVKGRSDLFLRLEIIKKINAVIMLFITVPISLIAMCIGSICTSIIALVINTYFTGKLINVGFFKQMYDLLPTIFYSLSMGLVVWITIQFVPGDFFKLLVGVPLGVVFYYLIAKITHSQDLKELYSFISSRK